MANILVPVFCVLFVGVSVTDGQTSNQHLSFQAVPQEIVPGLTQTLTITCGPGHLAHQYREIFLLQILADANGVQRPLATLQPGQSPSLDINDGRLSVTGNLDLQTPNTASLQVSLEYPSAVDAGKLQCQVVGLGISGNEVKNTDSLTITVHPETALVDALLRELVASLKTEADSLEAQTLLLQQENQRLAALATAKEAALNQRRSQLQQMKAQMRTLQQTVDAREITLNDTAWELKEEIANVTADAPPMRVAFNAQERTERVYSTGVQVEFETVEMNEGNGYNSTISTFKAPVAGVYYFTTSQLAHDSTSAGYRSYSIRRNSTIVSASFNADDIQSSRYKQSSTGTIVTLTPYDLVRVYTQYASASTTSLTPYSNTPNGKSTNFIGYLMY